MSVLVVADRDGKVRPGLVTITSGPGDRVLDLCSLISPGHAEADGP